MNEQFHMSMRPCSDSNFRVASNQPNSPQWSFALPAPLKDGFRALSALDIAEGDIDDEGKYASAVMARLEYPGSPLERNSMFLVRLVLDRLQHQPPEEQRSSTSLWKRGIRKTRDLVGQVLRLQARLHHEGFTKCSVSVAAMALLSEGGHRAAHEYLVQRFTTDAVALDQVSLDAEDPPLLSSSEVVGPSPSTQPETSFAAPVLAPPDAALSVGDLSAVQEALQRGDLHNEEELVAAVQACATLKAGDVEFFVCNSVSALGLSVEAVRQFEERARLALELMAEVAPRVSFYHSALAVYNAKGDRALARKWVLGRAALVGKG